MSDRLKAVARGIEPPKPPARHAAVALGIVQRRDRRRRRQRARPNQPRALNTLPPARRKSKPLQLEAPTDAVGGALYATEPGSVDDLTVLAPIRSLNTPQPTSRPIRLTLVDLDPIPEVRDPTFIERIRPSTRLQRGYQATEASGS